ncbi:MAG: hypothetical protein K6T70_08145 [Meiothermus ruber]|jgi:hypothetical protein|uniref:hypothetical protein n=1 Tax=Meiothermus ruber TaxID=277 RepID=UPI0023F6423C|nr:hypothetical protein [Meiothermus ruber]MCL6530073.1 hypothetical protein [Meiothermus ruber]
MNASDLIENNELLGRWFYYQGRDCVVRAVSAVRAERGRAGYEVGTWALEVDGVMVERVYGTLEAATRRLMERL